MRGTVKLYNDIKGFGFIDGEDGVEYYLHQSEIFPGERIRDGQRVKFEGGKGANGKFMARNVQTA